MLSSTFSLVDEREVDMATWATTADVLLYTKATVTDEDIVRAEVDIAMFVGVSPEEFDADLAASTDPYFLKIATVWQAKHLASGNGEAFNHDVTSVSQDGMSTNFTATAAVLHPRAKWAIGMLSWNRTKRVDMHPRFYGGICPELSYIPGYPWRTLR